MTERQNKLFVIIGTVLLLMFFVFLIWLLPANAQTTMGPIRTPQINQELYVGQISYPTIQSAVTFACATGNRSYAVVILPGVVTNDTPYTVTGGCNTSYIADLHTTPQLYYSWNGSAYILNSQTATSDFARQSAAVLNFTGTVHIASGTVANSPICTQTTGCPGSAGGGGFTWPPIGIAVSAGSSWGTAIDPTTLVTKDASGNIAVSGAITSVRGTRLAQGTDLNTLNTCGDFDGFNLLNVPPQLPVGGQYLNNVGIHVWCTGDPDYVVQFAWNMTQWGQPTEIFARNYRAGAWTAWTSFIFDDGAGNVAISGSIDSGRVLTLGTPQDLNAISRQGIYYLPAGCSANCPNPTDHTLDPRDGFLLQGISPGNAIWQQFQSPNDWILGTIYIRTYIRGAWSGWTQHLPTGTAFMRTCATCAYHSVDLTRSQVNAATTPKASKQTCRKNAMWHDENFMYVCVKNGEIKRTPLAAF